MLSAKKLKLKGAEKLQPKFIGSFQVAQRVGKQAYKLLLPEKYFQIHNVFHVSKLEPWKSRGETVCSENVPDLEDQEAEYEIEDICDDLIQDGEKYYFVQWKDWPVDYSEWVWEGDMENAPNMTKKYEKGLGQRKRKMREQTLTQESFGVPGENRPLKGKRGRSRKNS